MEIKNETLFYKYRDFGKYTDQIILNSELYFTSPKSFNDPFDCNLQFRDISTYTNPEIRKFKKSIIKKTSGIKKDIKQTKSNKEFILVLEKEFKSKKNESGILCLSLTYNNILMWSHYANSHKGLCFGFEALKDYNDSFSKGSIVKYTEDEKYKLISVLEEEYAEEITRLVTTKSEFWKYEEEYRFITISSNGNKKFSKKCLKEIIFGHKSTKINMGKIIKLCQDNGFEHVKFKKAKLVHGKFALDFDEIDKKDYIK